MALGSLLLALSIPIFGRPQAELLRLKPTVNQRLGFRMDLSMELAKGGKDYGGVEAVMLLGERVLKVEQDLIESRHYFKIERLDGTGEGGTAIAELLRAIGGGEYRVETDHRGQSLKITSGPTGISASTVDVILPERPVAPGDRWEGDYGSGKPIRLAYTLRGIAPVAGRRVALVDVVSATPLDPTATMTVTKDSVFALDLADGRWLRVRADFVGDSDGMSLKMRYEIVRDGAPDWPTILAALPKAD